MSERPGRHRHSTLRGRVWPLQINQSEKKSTQIGKRIYLLIYQKHDPLRKIQWNLQTTGAHKRVSQSEGIHEQGTKTNSIFICKQLSEIGIK